MTEIRSGREVNANYEKRVALIANIDVVVKFDKLKYNLSSCRMSSLTPKRCIVSACSAISFHDSALAEQALTHRSFGGMHNERLEFLGDSIVNFIVAEACFSVFPIRAKAI